MSGFDDLASGTPDVQALLLDVVAAVLSQQALAASPRHPAGLLVDARVAILDQVTSRHAMAEVRIGMDLAQVLACEMMHVADPDLTDVLDAVAELANICGGNLKTLLCEHARLSLPSAAVVDHIPRDIRPTVHVGAVVLGHTVELALHEVDHAAVRSAGLLWSPGEFDEILERSQ